MTEPSDFCPFCAIVAGDAPADMVYEWPDAVAFTPRGGGVGRDHILVVPRTHVRDFISDPQVTASVMARAAQLAETLGVYPANLITSAGPEATQTVFHLHVHLIRRTEGDGLALPWTKREDSDAH